ncbi:MAG: MFS transporter [Acidobacteria bacterium]|nr:MAG: MFS transporter [Acidobacteriota bacterium]PYU46704.1 MAG: MFS transporter [Acidobacteriota bacterium]PYU74840.1 MAG: MFS transporter [Acidobacteriota bacterium]
MTNHRSTRIFYGWWIVVAAFLNLFFAVGIIFYGFPVFYPAFVESLGFLRAQVTQGFLLGFLVAGLPFGLLAGAVIDRIGARGVILSGAGLVGISLLLMGSMTRLWHYELFCIMEVLGYVLAGPIANQVLVAHWFHMRRGRAMGYAYLGLGLGGVISPLLVHFLMRNFGWRHALEIVGLLILLVLFPVGIWITRSTPGEMGLLPDGAESVGLTEERNSATVSPASGVGAAIRSANFWLILAGSTLVMGAIGSVIQHFILFLKDQGYSVTTATRFSTALLASSLGGRVVVGYLADRFRKKNTMALFYALLSASLLFLGMARRPVAVWTFALIFGFSMGADYMLIPLVTAECFGTASLGKLLALIIMGYSLGQWGAPWMAGRIFDSQHSYELAWKIMAAAGLFGAAAIYAVSDRRNTKRV